MVFDLRPYNAIRAHLHLYMQSYLLHFWSRYDIRVNPNDEHELFMPDGDVAGDLLLREKLPTVHGTSFPRPRQFHAHGYVSHAPLRALLLLLLLH